jgi:hypothetical protein
VRLALWTALAVALALALPTTASAATTVGSSMPAFGGDTLVCADFEGCTFAPTSIAGKPVVMPFDGVIVGWTAQVPSGHGIIGLRALRPVAGGALASVGAPRLVFPEPHGRVATSARVLVRKGDLIAVDLDDGEEIGVAPHASVDSASHSFFPQLGASETRPPSQTDSDDFEMLFNAIVEPDADRDGYGDETQDDCPQLAETRNRCLGTASLGVSASGQGTQPKTQTAIVLAGERARVTASVGSFANRLPNVVVTFTLEPELRAVAASAPGGCTIAAQRVICTVGQVAARKSGAATIELQALRPGKHRFFPGSPPLTKFDVTATTGLPRDVPARSGHIRVLATGSCANPNEITDFDPESFGGDRLVGGPDIDRVNGLGGGDCIFGKGHDDRLGGGDGDDRLVGGPGDDILRGEGWDDVLIGGPGRDRLEGGADDDRIAAVDRERDLVRCGSGRDRATVDTVDSVSGCERVKRVPQPKQKRRR